MHPLRTVALYIQAQIVPFTDSCSIYIQAQIIGTIHYMPHGENETPIY